MPDDNTIDIKITTEAVDCGREWGTDAAFLAVFVGGKLEGIALIEEEDEDL